MIHLFQAIADLGGAVVLVPASFALWAVLFLDGDRMRAMFFLLAIGVCASLTVLAKLGFLMWGGEVYGLRVHSPSGDSSLSGTFYGCFAILATSCERKVSRIIACTTAGAVVMAIAVDRFASGAHTLSEVTIGLTIGLSCVALFQKLGDRVAPSPHLAQVAMLVLGTSILQHGMHLSIEPFLKKIADGWS
jgi:membrane-associated phospholipid phosphatase